VLFNGRLYAELKSVTNAKKLGNSDARAAASAARREDFPAHTIIFLDQEQGGRMLPEQKAYIYAWVDGVTTAGFRAGIYCSGIPNKDDENIVTAEDIRQSAGEGRSFTGRSMMPARLHRAVHFPRTRQAPPKAAFPSPRSGSSRNRHSAKTLPVTAPTTAATVTVTLPEFPQPSDCMWT